MYKTQVLLGITLLIMSFSGCLCLAKSEGHIQYDTTNSSSIYEHHLEICCDWCLLQIWKRRNKFNSCPCPKQCIDAMILESIKIYQMLYLSSLILYSPWKKKNNATSFSDLLPLLLDRFSVFLSLYPCYIRMCAKDGRLETPCIIALRRFRFLITWKEETYFWHGRTSKDPSIFNFLLRAIEKWLLPIPHS